MDWAYGVTTVDCRLDTLLPRTLESLAKAGFERPRLFIDGPPETLPTAYASLEQSIRLPRARSFSNWYLAATELYLRHPQAEFYALFQDDLIACRNLRAYLEQCTLPSKSYLNLYTFPINRKAGAIGWTCTSQKGKGAVALVFTRKALRVLLSDRELVSRTENDKGHRSIDGGIVEAMNRQGYLEFVHQPSLVQHTGLESSMDNARHPLAVGFLGQDFDALRLLECHA